MPVAATYVNEPVLSNVWWPLALEDGISEAASKALILWLNSSIGIMALLGHRTETEGAFIAFKKPILEEMPILDISSLSNSKLKNLGDSYNILAMKNLLPLPNMCSDPIRQNIDTAIEKSLGISSLVNIRTMLAREPIIANTMNELSPPKR
jgi:hypothetical protein